MKPERWQQIERLCHAALEVEEEHRAAFLEEACGGDKTLRREVEHLLAQETKAEDFLETPALEVEAKAMAQDQANSMVGRQIGSYKIVSLLGIGGMGEVYLAEDASLKRKVALKFLPEEMRRDEIARKRFLREARSAAALDHPFICHIHEVGKSDGKEFIAMEYVEGKTLKDKLDEAPLPLKEALPTAVEIAEAVEKAHQKGIVHRDLKPSNIMLTPEGHVKVMDFGLAKRVAAEGSEQEITSALTTEGSALGTVPYMSPEQLRGKRVDTRSDIFSFGVVLYEMLTGVHPFRKSQPMETAHAILSEVPPPLSRYRNEAPPVLQHTVRKMLAKDPDRRYQLIHDVRTNLAEMLGQVADSTVEDVSRDTTGLGSERPAGKSWRRAIPWSMMALMALVAAVAIWREAPPAQGPVSRSTIKLPPGQNITARAAIALSTDGQTLAYVAQESGAQRLYVRPMDEFEAKPIPGSEGAEGPFFSPDGNWVAFFADSKLKKVSTSGGSPLIICDYPRIFEGRSFVSGSWAPDETILFANSATHGIWQVSARGGTAEPITDSHVGEFDEVHLFPQVLPGGKVVLFSGGAVGSTDWRIMAHSLETGEQQSLVKPGAYGRYLPTGHLVYYWENNLLAVPFDVEELRVTGPSVPILEAVTRRGFGASESGTLAYVPGQYSARFSATLVWVDHEGTVEPLALPPGSYWGPRVSPDGRQLIYFGVEEDFNVYVYNLERGTLGQLTVEEGNGYWPIWTPDGKRLIFNSNRHGGLLNLYWKPGDGSGQAERLTESKYNQQPQSCSPDGKLLAYQEEIRGPESTGYDIWVLSLEGRGKPQAFMQTPANEFHPMFSPDGQWLAYVSDQTGKNEIYVRPYPGPGGLTVISTAGGTDPAWAPNGKQLYYLESAAGSAMRLMSVPVQIGPTLRPEKPRLLFAGNYGGGIFGRGYDLEPDGERFLMIQRTESQTASTQINVVLNWFEELKRLVPTDN